MHKTQPKVEEEPQSMAQLEEVKQLEQPEQPEQTHQPEIVQPEEKVEDGNTLEQIWAQIMVTGEELGPRINQALQAANPEKTSDNTIKIQITAESHKELYEKHKASVYDVLVAELGIKDLKFEWELVKSELESKRPLKDAEKYQAMAEENPALKLLKEKFNLDIKK